MTHPRYPVNYPLKAIYLDENDWQMIRDSLRYYCKMEAGQTQAPDLLDKEDYAEWDLAKYLESKIK